MNDYIKDKIVGTNRHQFIYGENSHERTRFLKDIEGSHKLAIGQDTPSVIYLRPSFKHENSTSDRRLMFLSIAHLETILEIETLTKIKNNIPLDVFDNVAKNLYRIFSAIYETPIDSLDEALVIMNRYIKKFDDWYNDICLEKKSIGIDLNYPRYLMFELLVSELKRAIDFKSYFAVIIDHKERLDDFYTKAINNFVNSRYGNISMKVVTHPDEWESYITTSGNIVQYDHDYDIVELDDSFKKHILRKKGNF